MTNETTRQPACTILRAEIAAILARYPDLTDAELQRVLRWFSKEATAMDVAMLSCDEDIAPQYRQFRSDHIDRFGLRDMRNAAVFLGVVAGIPLACFLLWGSGFG